MAKVLKDIEMLHGVYNPELDNRWMTDMRNSITENRWQAPPTLCGGSFFTGSALRYIHFPHIDPEDSNKIRFVDSIIAGRKGKTTSMRIGRYLTKHFKDSIGSEGAVLAVQQKIVYETAPVDVKFAVTMDDIEWVYSNGPRSCMSKPVNTFQVPEHPCRMYSAGDLQVAYILNADGKKPGARAVCWPAKKHYVRIYGDISRLQRGLEGLGYTKVNNFAGARLVKKPYRSTFIVPYVDGNARYVLPTQAGSTMTLYKCGDYPNLKEIGSEWGWLNEPDVCCEVCEEEGTTTTDDLVGPVFCDRFGTRYTRYLCPEHFEGMNVNHRLCDSCGGYYEGYVHADSDIFCARCSGNGDPRQVTAREEPELVVPFEE